MGSLQASEFAGAVSDGRLSLASAIGWHLQSNHYPPVPVAFNPVCIAAIEAANEGNDGTLIALPEGIEWKDGRDAVEAYVLIDSFRLDAFVEDDDWDDDDDECEGHEGTTVGRYNDAIGTTVYCDGSCRTGRK